MLKEYPARRTQKGFSPEKSGVMSVQDTVVVIGYKPLRKKKNLGIYPVLIWMDGWMDGSMNDGWLDQDRRKTFLTMKCHLVIVKAM